MFKRMSVLARRPDHDRRTFSALWERHAAPVSALPGIRGYIQNHVEEDFSAISPIRADGFVELLWDTPQAMADAFASPAAAPMVADEPGFLGHGSGYALSGGRTLREAPGGKLIVAVVGASVELEAAADRLARLTVRLRDEVADLIPKPGMAPPQPVDAFLHLWFESVAAARTAGVALAAQRFDGAQAGVYRVRTIRFV